MTRRLVAQVCEELDLHELAGRGRRRPHRRPGSCRCRRRRRPRSADHAGPLARREPPVERTRPAPAQAHGPSLGVLVWSVASIMSAFDRALKRARQETGTLPEAMAGAADLAAAARRRGRGDSRRSARPLRTGKSRCARGASLNRGSPRPRGAASRGDTPSPGKLLSRSTRLPTYASPVDPRSRSRRRRFTRRSAAEVAE